MGVVLVSVILDLGFGDHFKYLLPLSKDNYSFYPAEEHNNGDVKSRMVSVGN